MNVIFDRMVVFRDLGKSVIIIMKKDIAYIYTIYIICIWYICAII